jgi:hypothetical protein
MQIRIPSTDLRQHIGFPLAPNGRRGLFCQLEPWLELGEHNIIVPVRPHPRWVTHLKVEPAALPLEDMREVRLPVEEAVAVLGLDVALVRARDVLDRVEPGQAGREVEGPVHAEGAVEAALVRLQERQRLVDGEVVQAVQEVGEGPQGDDRPAREVGRPR